MMYFTILVQIKGEAVWEEVGVGEGALPAACPMETKPDTL